MQLEKKLDNMIGKTFMFRTNQITVQSYNIDDDQLTIATNKKWIRQNISTMNGFLDEFLDIDQGVGTSVAIRETMNQTAESARVARDALIDNIKKIQQDPKYIPQANEIQKSCKSLIELVKAEIEVARMTSK